MLASQLEARAILRAVVDNMCHAVIAAASWVVVFSLRPPSLKSKMISPRSPLSRCIPPMIFRRANQDYRKVLPETSPREHGDRTVQPSGFRKPIARFAAWEVPLVACLGSALDVDHFLAARSLRLSMATGLSQRPWGHSVAALVVLALVTFGLTYSRRAAVAVFSAGASHQLRDATRRGLWISPPRGPKTPPLIYSVYLLAQAGLPLLLSLFLHDEKSSSRHRGGDPESAMRTIL